ncbi:hypothetical protein HGRIS_008713 [Hohenbuehelia grisea]|uniref:F-box domain-containing protein n=1 Tax=Hohenbuehelia grisea TaxID=104357 RepID=A0ABR3J931_9AGAR
MVPLNDDNDFEASAITLRPASMRDLPSEVLLKIFKLVHEEISQEEQEAQSWGAFIVDERCRQRGLFPYGFSSVCSAWKQVTSSCPDFWTRIVSFIDVAWEPVTIADQIAWTQNREFSIYLITSGNGGLASPLESPRVAQGMKALMPNLARCTSLCVHTFNSSALPSATELFTRSAPMLKSVAFDCVVDDGGTALARPCKADGESSIIGNGMELNLSIDGPNFIVSACLVTRHDFSCITFLSISHLSSSSRNGQALPIEIFSRVLAQFTILRELSITDIDFRPLPSGFDLDDKHRIPTLQMFHIDDIRPREAVRDLFRLAEYTSIGRFSMRNCSLAAVEGGQFPDVRDSLVFYDIPDSPSDVHFIGDWDGSELTLDNCNVLTRDICEILSEEKDGTFSLHSLECLYIEQCSDVPLAAIRTAIELRNIPFILDEGEGILNYDYDVHDPFIRAVHILGSLPKLSPQERAWFQVRMVDFTCD